MMGKMSTIFRVVSSIMYISILVMCGYLIKFHTDNVLAIIVGATLAPIACFGLYASISGEVGKRD